MEDGISRGLQHRHKTCCEKGGCHGRRACRVQRWHHRGDVVFRTGELAYDNRTPLSLIGKVIDKLKEEKYFNKLDLIWESRKEMNGKPLS